MFLPNQASVVMPPGESPSAVIEENPDEVCVDESQHLPTLPQHVQEKVRARRRQSPTVEKTPRSPAPHAHVLRPSLPVAYQNMSAVNNPVPVGRLLHTGNNFTPARPPTVRPSITESNKRKVDQLTYSTDSVYNCEGFENASDHPNTGNLHQSYFQSPIHASLWSIVCRRQIIREHSLEPRRVRGLGILEHLSDLGLSKTAVDVPPYVLQVVREFYANLPLVKPHASTEHAFKAFIRGYWIDFSPLAINRFLGFVHRLGVSMDGSMDNVAAEITAGAVKGWPYPKGVKAASLSYKYSIYHKIAVRNWMPAKHCTNISKAMAMLLYNVGTKGHFDFGKMVFDRIMTQAGSNDVGRALCFPSLIFRLIQSQVSVLQDSDNYELPTPNIIITERLKNTFYHVNDIPCPVTTELPVTDSSLTPTDDLPRTYRERVTREISLELQHLDRLILASKTRKNYLTALLTDLQRESTSQGQDPSQPSQTPPPHADKEGLHSDAAAVELAWPDNNRPMDAAETEVDDVHGNTMMTFQYFT